MIGGRGERRREWLVDLLIDADSKRGGWSMRG